jgi:hypothetical protein
MKITEIIMENTLRAFAALDQSERNEFGEFLKSQAGGDFEQGTKLWAAKKKRPANDIFGDLVRQRQFMKMKFDFDKFTEQDWFDYWIIAQHCDDFRQFQQQALRIIKQYLGTDHAYYKKNNYYKSLSDRISCGFTGTQTYGTQTMCVKDTE